MFSRKIRVVEKLLNFHNVKSKLGCPGLYLLQRLTAYKNDTVGGICFTSGEVQVQLMAFFSENVLAIANHIVT